MAHIHTRTPTQMHTHTRSGAETKRVPATVQQGAMKEDHQCFPFPLLLIWVVALIRLQLLEIFQGKGGRKISMFLLFTKDVKHSLFHVSGTSVPNPFLPLCECYGIMIWSLAASNHVALGQQLGDTQGTDDRSDGIVTQKRSSEVFSGECAVDSRMASSAPGISKKRRKEEILYVWEKAATAAPECQWLLHTVQTLGRKYIRAHFHMFSFRL